MLKAQVENKVDSWAIRWYASAFLKNMYTLYPKESIINNIGADGTGTHEGSVDNVKNIKWNDTRKVNVVYDKNIENNPLALNRWKIYHKQKK